MYDLCIVYTRHFWKVWFLSFQIISCINVSTATWQPYLQREADEIHNAAPTLYVSFLRPCKAEDTNLLKDFIVKCLMKNFIFWKRKQKINICKHYPATGSSSEELIVATLAPCKMISIPSILMQPELWKRCIKSANQMTPLLSTGNFRCQ